MADSVNILYFASLRETLGLASEKVEIASETTLARLIETLRARGGAYGDALDPKRRFRAAINQDMAALDTVLAAGDEVAIFPPVTGG